MARSIRHIFLCVCVLLGWQSASFAQSTISLSYFSDVNNGVQWNWFDPTTQTSSTAHVFKERPSALFWEKNNSRIRVITGNRILDFNKHGKQIQNNGPDTVPELENNERPIGIWRDMKDKTLRLATWIQIPENHLIKQNGHLALKLSSGNAVPALLNPEWGLHVLIRLFKWDNMASSWNLETSIPTKSYAGDTPGLSVLKPYWKEFGFSHMRLSASKYCASNSSVFEGRQCHGSNINQEFHKRVIDETIQNSKQRPEMELINCQACLFEIVHPTIEGDTLHAALPIYLRNKTDKSYTHLQFQNTKPFDQTLIEVKENYALVEIQKKASSIFVVDLGKGKSIFSAQGYNAWWIPKE